MKSRILVSLAILGGLAPLGGRAQTPDARAPQNLAQTVELGCATEIKAHCEDVAPGEGRVVACLYSHQEKLSPRCEYALYDASAQLDRAVAALNYLASECEGDLQRHCSGVETGQGRLLQCLRDHEEELTNRCHTALQDVGHE